MYSYARRFSFNFRKNTGISLKPDDFAYIKSICETTAPYRKVDNKGRDSEYFTFLFKNRMITVVCDARKKLILTAIIETHQRPQFYRS